jgi:hypothetical protein
MEKIRKIEAQGISRDAHARPLYGNRHSISSGSSKVQEKEQRKWLEKERSGFILGYD